MPPTGLPRPASDEIDKFVSWLETSLDRAALAKPNPGRVVHPSPQPHGIRQRDPRSASLEIDVAATAAGRRREQRLRQHRRRPEVSPSLLEQYLAASRKISSLAVGDPATLR